MNALLPYWLRLTGGEQSCPRGRFALTMLAAYGLFHLLMQKFMHCALTLLQHAPASTTNLGALILILGIALALVGLLLAFLPLSPLALLGLEVTLVEGYRLVQGGGSPTSPAPDALWPCWLGFTLAAPTLLLAGAVAFGSAWRRLRDAGHSPLFLLLGLTYLLGFGYDGSYAAESAGLYLLGPLWLIILYSQPGEGGKLFEIFRSIPERVANIAPRAEKNALTASTKQGARQKGTETRVTSSPSSRGKNQSSAGTRPSPPNDAASYRRRMRARVQAARKRS